MSEIDQALYDKLYQAFNSGSSIGISEAERALFYPNYPDFPSFLKEFASKQTISVCPASWTDSIQGVCYDCQKSKNSCLCLPCFIAGHHDEHNSILKISSGNCDCGDPLFWKSEGNCPNHKGCVENPDVEYLTEDERKRFLAIFLAALNGTLTFKKTDQSNPYSLKLVFQWLIRFVDVGDSIRRLLSIALCQVDQLLLKSVLLRSNKEDSEIVFQLIIKLVSDSYFGTHFSKFIYNNLNEFYERLLDQSLSEESFIQTPPYYGIIQFWQNCFHFFIAQKYIKVAFENGSYNIEDLFINFFQLLVNTLKEDFNEEFVAENFLVDNISIFQESFNFLNESKNYEILNKIIARMAPLLSEAEKIYPYVIRDKPENSSYNYKLYTTFALMASLKQLFACLVKTKLDIKPVFDALVNLYIKDESNITSESTSTFEPNVRIRTALPLTYLFFTMAIEYKEEMVPLLKKLCEESKISYDDFIMKISVGIIRYFSLLRNSSFFRYMNERNLYGLMMNYSFVYQHYISLFSFLQYSMCIVEDKDRFFRCIAYVFGIYDKNENLRPTATFLQFVGSLLIDRICVSNDLLAIQRNQMIAILKKGHATAKDLSFGLKDTLFDPKLADELNLIADHKTTPEGSFFKLKDDSGFHCFLPILTMPSLIDLVDMNHQKALVFPIKKNCEFVNGFHVPSFSKTVLSIVFSTIIDFRDTPSTIFALSIFELLCQLRNVTDDVNDSVVLENLDILNMEQLLNEKNFLKALYKEKTIVDYILNYDEGEFVLERCNIGYIPKQKSEELIQLKKKSSQELKQKIMTDYQRKSERFIQHSLNYEANEEAKACSVCKNPIAVDETNEEYSKLKEENNKDDQLIGYPAMISPSVAARAVQAIIDGKEWMCLSGDVGILDLHICNHPFHLSCKPESRVFMCPVCKMLRMLILPSIPKLLRFDSPDFKAAVSDTVQSAINAFVLSYFENKEIGTINSIINTINYHTHATEIRFRSVPDILDRKELPIILSNLFRILFFYTKIQSQEELSHAIEVSKKNPFNSFLLELLKQKNTDNFVLDVKSGKRCNSTILNAVHNVIKNYNNVLLPSSEPEQEENENEKRRIKLFEFLRRVAILSYFGIRKDVINLGNNNSKVIDWDEILSFGSLCNIFEISENEEPNRSSIELKSYEGPPLAEKFISNFQSPFNYNIFDRKNPYLLDLLTGTVIHGGNLHTYSSTYYKLGSSIYLVLSGPESSSILVYCPLLKKQISQKSFYVDKFGDDDIGYQRGVLTQLSRDRLYTAIDRFLDNSFINLQYK